MSSEVIKRDKGSLPTNIGKNFEHNIIMKILLDNILLKKSFFLYQYFLDIAFFDILKKELTIIEAKSTIQEKPNLTLNINEVIKKFDKIIDNDKKLYKCTDYNEWKINNWIWTNKKILLSTKHKQLDTHSIEESILFNDLTKNVQEHFCEEVVKKYNDFNRLKNILENFKFNIHLQTLREFENEIKQQIKNISILELNINLTDRQVNEIHDLIRDVLNRVEQNIYDTDILFPKRISELYDNNFSIKTQNLINIIEKFNYNYLGNTEKINLIISKLINNVEKIQSPILKETIQNLNQLDNYEYILDSIYKTINRSGKIKLENFISHIKIFLTQNNNYSQEKLIELIFDKLFDNYKYSNKLNLYLYSPIELIIISIALVLNNNKGEK